MSRKRKMAAAEEFQRIAMERWGAMNSQEQAEFDAWKAAYDQRSQIRLDLLSGREALDLTQSKLAALAGLDQSEISKLESPDGNPTLLTLGKVARALGLEVRLVPRES
jgi:DNA-binding XRE family transcriptional regulator